MKSLPTIDPGSYEFQESHNNELVNTIFGQLFPETGVPYGAIYQIFSYLQETKVNAQVLPRVIRGIHNLTLGTGDGEVIVHVRRDTITVETKERDGEIKTRNL